MRFALPDETRKELLDEVLAPHRRTRSEDQQDLDADGDRDVFLVQCEELAGKLQRMREVQLERGSGDELLIGAESRRGKAILSAERAAASWHRAVQKLANISADEGGAFATELPALEKNAKQAVRIVGKLRARMPRRGQMPDPINKELTEGCREILTRFGIHAKPGSVDGSREGASPLFTLRKLIWDALPNAGDVPDQRPYAGDSNDARDALEDRAAPRVYVHPDEPKPVANRHLRDEV